MKKLIAIFEYLLVFGYSVAILSASYQESLILVPHLEIIATCAVLAIISYIVFKHLRNPSAPLRFIWVFALAATSFFAVYSSPSPASRVFTSPLVIITMGAAGMIGQKHSWIAAFFVFTFGETARTLFMLLASRSSITPALLLDKKLLDPFHYLYPFLAGLLPALTIQAILKRQGAATGKALIPESMGHSVPETTPQAEKHKTQSFIVEPLSDCHVEEWDDRDLSDLLSSVVYFMSRNFRCFSSLGFIFDPKRQLFLLNSFQSKSLLINPGISIPIGHGIIGKIGSEKRSFMTGDLRVYDSELMYYSSDESINSILAVPIISESNELLGALTLDSKDKQAFRDQDKETLKRFSSLAAALITTARMRSYQERSARTFRIFYQASHQFTTALKPEHVFEVLFSVIPGAVRCTRQIGCLFDEEKGVGRVLKVSGETSDILEGFTFPINAGLYSFVFQKRKSVTIADFQQLSERYYRFLPGEIRDPSIRSLTVFPILDDEQRCRGLFSIESDEPDVFCAETEQVLATLLENASVAFTRSILYQRMETLATTDGLTGLNNHRNFQELLAKEMERSRRYKRPLSLLLMDIDHFKSFNDTYGHPVGDLVLKEIAACIRKSIRLNDIPARYGGEEFVVIIPETTQQGAMSTAERIRSTIEQHTIVSLDRKLKVTVSIGASAFPENAPSQPSLIDSADKALYMAKESGRNRVVLYKRGMGGN